MIVIDRVNQIALIAGRNKDQAKFLFSLCDEKIDAYIELEGLLKSKCPAYVPADKDTLLKFLEDNIESSDVLFSKRYLTNTSRFYYKSMQVFVENSLKKVEGELEDLISKKYQTYNSFGKETLIYNEETYKTLFDRLSAQKDILYMCLTGHNNYYNDKTKKGA